MGGAVSALVVFGVLLLVGAPIALSVPERRSDWTGVAFEAFVVGLVVETVVALTLLHAGWYNGLGVLVATVVVVGGATLAIRRFGGPRPDLSALRGLEPALIGLGAFVFVAGALLIRHAPSYFIFQTGDMGDYVNTANVFRQGGPLIAAQPQGFTVFLSGTNLLLGEAHTVAGVPALGAALLLGTIAFARALRLHLAAVIGIAVILLVHPIFVWFSLFPVSETLVAVLLLAFVYFVVQARATRSPTYAVIGGIVAGSVLLARGEAMLLAPVLVIVLLASAVADDESTARVQEVFTYVALVSLLLAYAYDVANADVYFPHQLSRLLPRFAMNIVEDTHLERVSVPLALAGVLALAAVFGLVRLVQRLRPRIAGRELLFWRCASGAVIALALAGSLLYSVGGLKNSGLRWGAVLIVLVVIGAAGVVVRPGRYLDAVSGFLLLMLIGVFAVLFARRMAQPLVHAYYLYYDRYLVSEVLTAALPLAAIGIQIVVDACTRAPARVARVAIAATVVVIVVGLVPQMRETRRITEHRLFADSYDALEQLNRLTLEEGPGAVVYSGSKDVQPDWFYPNTYRAFALPLRQTFDRTVYGIPLSAIATDRVYTPGQARDLLRERQASSGYLVQLRGPDGRRLPDDDHTKWVGALSYRIPWLAQFPIGRPAPWTFAQMDLDVYALNGENR